MPWFWHLSTQGLPSFRSSSFALCKRKYKFKFKNIQLLVFFIVSSDVSCGMISVVARFARLLDLWPKFVGACMAVSVEL